jgi:hypothetical protein
MRKENIYLIIPAFASHEAAEDRSRRALVVISGGIAPVSRAQCLT